MIAKLLFELGKIEGRLQSLIAHVKSGVNHLNEAQHEEAKKLIAELDAEWQEVKASVEKHLGVEPAAAPSAPSDLPPAA